MSEAYDIARKGYIRLWPVWVAIGFPLLFIALEATPIAHDFIFVLVEEPSLMMAWTGLAVCAAILTARRLWRRAWREAVISAVLPLAVLGVASNSTTFIRFCNNAGDTVHFCVSYPSYMKAVRSAPSNGGPKLMTFNLGGMSWASRGFVYDESDQMLLKPSLQSPDWKARAQGSELSCGYGAVPIPGPSRFTRHWYIASFPC